MSFLRDLWTADAKSVVWDWLRVHGTVVVLVGLVAFLLCLVFKLPTDWLLTYCTSFASLLLAIAGGMALRKDDESDQATKGG